ncbi:MAG: cyclopropane-fatty-acyl-phospholipid synthase [Proteobacteria bacterium]|nr:cyclopropane-fatty-acyl-phospholipid synthase [Pseudomonadota bacterium]MDA0942262.1 cyclopropane-fatty-acyl-phospholipid synthase [Pseudomonadota bacterium]
MLKKIVFNQLHKITKGSLTLKDASSSYTFGDQKNIKLHAEILIHNPRFYRFVVFGGSIGCSEAYMSDYWSSPNLTNVIRLFAINPQLTDELESKFNILLKPFFRVIHRLNKNSQRNSKRNISAHYDLSNNFFKLFLDETMMYSSAIFKTRNQTLKAASLNKLDIICQKLNLKPTDHVVEIGSGWGGFAIFAAENYGCKVTTTTISQQQFSYTRDLINKKKLGKKITLLFEDYRNLEGKYDKLVSIEMIEAVGHHYYHEYFKKINTLLKPDGIALIQAITIRDQRYSQALQNVDFIQKNIFPGSCIPSIEIIQKNLTKETDMIISDLENINHHYAKTLNLWQKAFNKNQNKIIKLGFDERFIRMWNFYFSYCEGGFAERAINDFHILMSKPLNRTSQNEKDIF